MNHPPSRYQRCSDQSLSIKLRLNYLSFSTAEVTVTMSTKSALVRVCTHPSCNIAETLRQKNSKHPCDSSWMKRYRFVVRLEPFYGKAVMTYESLGFVHGSKGIRRTIRRRCPHGQSCYLGAEREAHRRGAKGCLRINEQPSWSNRWPFFRYALVSCTFFPHLQ